MTTRPLAERKLDAFYMVFFVVHIVVMLAVDLTPFYPNAVKPRWMTDLRTYYFETYHDQFAVNPPPLSENWHICLGCYLCCTSARDWVTAANGSSSTDHPLVPVHLLIYGLQTAMTTLTCVVDILSWVVITSAEKTQLLWLYGPYLALSIFMIFDMYFRLQKELVHRRATSAGKQSALQDKKRF